jgi:hypothetical protein
MTFTAEERRLLFLYRSGSAEETAAVVRDALRDISDPDVRAAAGSLLRKLEGMGGADTGFDYLDTGDFYG